MLQLLLLAALSGILQGESETWYTGCYKPDRDGDGHIQMEHVVVGQYTHAQCAQFCNNHRYEYAALQTSTVVQCGCVNTTSTFKQHFCCDTSGDERLPVGLTPGCYGIYTSEGPYLETVAMETDTDVVIVTRPVAMEIYIQRDVASNVSTDDPELGHQIHVEWSVRKVNKQSAFDDPGIHGDDLDLGILDDDLDLGNVTHTANIDMTGYTEIYHRPEYTFTHVGLYTVDVKVTNNISALVTSLDLEVIYPSPRDLQLSIPDNLHNPPSCIPNEVKVKGSSNQLLAVFVGVKVHLEASVSMGTNLTFTYWFEDNKEVKVIEACEECLSTKQEHVFAETGMFTIATNVSNSYGSLQKNITLVVIEKQISDLKIDIDSETGSLATLVGKQVRYTVSMVTTSRSDIYLQVWYGDGETNLVSISDTNDPALVLTGDGKDMDIVASYGNGCELIVEFSYSYDKAGLYRPSVALLNKNEKIEKKSKNDVVDFTSASEMNIGFGVLSYMYADSFIDNDVEVDNNVDAADDSIFLESELESEVLVLAELVGLQLHGKTVAKCDQMVTFSLQMPSKLNISVNWKIYQVEDPADNDLTELYNDLSTVNEESFEENENLKFISEFNTYHTELYHTFPQVGMYVVKVTASNLLSSGTTSVDIVIQCPIEGLSAKCFEEYIQTGSVVVCEARVDQGSDIVFTWEIEGSEFTHYQFKENYTSQVHHRFLESRAYDVSVHAVNNVSTDYYEVEPSIKVLDPIKHINIHAKSRILLGNVSDIAVWYSHTGVYYNCNFDFDFGNGRGSVAEPTFSQGYSYVQTQHIFPTVGKHSVKVYGYNDVSEISQTRDIWVYRHLNNTVVAPVREAVVGYPARFRLTENDVTMDTEDVYLTLTYDDTVYRTNSPIVQVMFNNTGNQSITIQATNPVVNETIEVAVFVRSRSEVNLQLLHDLYVTMGNEVLFNLKGPLIGWSELHISYSDRKSKIYKGVKYRWSHIFDEIGTQKINVTLIGAAGTVIEVITSYIIVEQPITGLEIEGPSLVALGGYDDYEHQWRAKMDTGSHVIYKWTFGDTYITTIPEFHPDVEIARDYLLQLECFNDVTAPIIVSLPVIIQYIVEGVRLNIKGGLVGQQTYLELTVSAYHDFTVDINYGDGQIDKIHSMDENIDIKSVKENSHILYVSHVFTEVKEFTIKVNVSNSVSSQSCEEVFIPIGNVSLTTRSPWLLYTPGHVIVMATVVGGRGLTFTWNFSDDYEETIVNRYSEQRSEAKHRYGMAGEYRVSFNVTSEHYKPPGVYVTLRKNFTVVDPIILLEMKVNKNYAALENNSTKPVVFMANSSGSHVHFLFDFGDGNHSEELGQEMPFMVLDMTMRAETSHVYTQVGVYKVKVTAINPLGNKTVSLSQLFYVQAPPTGLYLCEKEDHSMGMGNIGKGSYSAHVGETITICADVMSGTNVTFDWKLGDQTDIVKAGPVVSHEYHSTGVKTVYVTAKNRVTQLERRIHVHVNHEIQGVEVIPESRVVALEQSMVYTAVVRPNYTDIVTTYSWRFKSSSRSTGRRRSGMATYTSKQNKVTYSFLEAGVCTVSVMAKNGISNATSPSVNIYVIAKIKGLKIIVVGNKAERLVNRPIRFEYFIYLGSNLTLTWDFRDGSEPVVTTKFDVEHTYLSEAGYTLTLTATNAVSSQTVSIALFILHQSYCAAPVVKILNQPGTKVYYSKPFTMEADVRTDCNLTTVMKYYWSISGHVIGSHIETHKRVLVLPPGSLHYGTYNVTFKVTMRGTIVYATDMTYIDIIHSALVAHIVGGVYRRVTRNMDVVLDGSTSLDPDAPGNITFRHSWTCRYMKENGNYGDVCFHSNSTHNTSCNVTMDTDVLHIPIDCLIEASNFTFELTVYTDGRQNGTAFQMLDIPKWTTDILDVEIFHSYSKSQPVNADRKLSFSVQCSTCQAPGMRYEWSLSHLIVDNIFNLARAHDRGCVEPDGSTYRALKLEEEEDLKLEGEGLTEEAVLTEEAGSVEEFTGQEQQKIGEEDHTFVVERGGLTEEDSVIGQSTALPFLYGQIIEDRSSNVHNRRRPMVKEDQNQQVLVDLPQPEIIENIEPEISRRRPTKLAGNFEMQEGNPGESGSSGGRQLVNTFTPVTEGLGSGRKINTGSQADPSLGSGGSLYPNIDKLVSERQNYNRKYTILDHRPVPAYLRDSQTKTGLTSESLVIKPGTLKQGLTYLVQVDVYNDELGIEGRAISSFVVNESPVWGSCTIKPDNGTAVDTEFNVYCKAWDEKHVPLMYEVSYNLDSTATDRNIIYRGVDNEFSFKLPPGNITQDYNVYVYIDILDALLAKTSVCSIAIQVLPRGIVGQVNDTGPGSDRGHGALQGTKGSKISRTRLPEAGHQIIDDEALFLESSLREALDHGNDAMSKVYIGYLATWLNTISDTAADSEQEVLPEQEAAYDVDNTSAAYIIDNTGYGWRGDKQYREETRTWLLTVLKDLPVRDEAELLQSAQSLAYITAQANELSLMSLDLCLKILKSITAAASAVYNDDLPPTGDLVTLVVKATSSVVEATRDIAQTDTTLREGYQRMVTETIQSLEHIILNELKFHVIAEAPIQASTDYFSVLASRHFTHTNQSVVIQHANFKLPDNLDHFLSGRYQTKDQSDSTWTNQNCFQSHMTLYKRNPFSFVEDIEVNTLVSGLNLYRCDGSPIVVDSLPEDDRLSVQLPNIPPQGSSETGIVLKKWAMNVHQFNVTLDNLEQALHLVINLVPVKQGRLFPITLLISHLQPPLPDRFEHKFDFPAGENLLEIFLPAGSFNTSGTYYIGLVDTTYNTGRRRPGEITLRNYTFQLWWGQCLYWHDAKQAWRADGCTISQESTFEVTKCSCSHLTSFGGKFELVPNELSLVDVENFFSPQKNPVTTTLIAVVLILYFVLFLWCRHADKHDARKGGIVYLLDNAPSDQQKYEITVETGIRNDAGTTAKISLILHGEEGMSETRELISEDDRPLFERNSRDKFILTLPDSIGRIWKVQIWHNNFGTSPSWYLNKVIVRDLNTGQQYFFLCEKWLAVEEQDGKVEREFMLQDGTLVYGEAFTSKGVEYVSDFHLWLSLMTCPPYSGFMRTERLTLCLTMIMMYMCLNAMWYDTAITEYRGEFGLLDLSWRNVTVGAICCAVVIPISLLLEFIFRRSKPKHASSGQSKDGLEVNEWDQEYASGKPNEAESEDSSEHVPPVMTYSLLDQSILNWPNIQTWAQKQWMKRQQSVRSGQDNHSGGDSVGSDHSLVVKQSASTNMDMAFIKQGLLETDQASSGFEDCSSLIRPKASVDSTHTTAAPSVAESMRTHKPPSLPDSRSVSKPTSESDSSKTSKAPSISYSAGSKMSSVTMTGREKCKRPLYLPYWCRYLAWTMCLLISIGCATVTIMYGFRFGVTKSTLWLQSLYFSFMICVFISNPVLILLGVLYHARHYKNDPTCVDMYGYDIYNREKAKEDLIQWKKQLELWEEGEAEERGVAARQRSRYLRFARPPQEKQLIEARKRVMKEKKAIAIFRESVVFILTVFILLIMAYGKDTSPSYHLNKAVKVMFTRSGVMTFTSIRSQDDWYHWTQTSFLDAVDTLYRRDDSNGMNPNTVIIGNVQLRQQRVATETCPTQLPYVTSSCLGNTVAKEMGSFGRLPGLSYTNGYTGNFIFGNHDVYDGSGFILSINKTRSEAEKQIDSLCTAGWLDRHTRAVFLELTLYNVATNLFTAVDLLFEVTPTGSVYTVAKVTSTQIFRYVTGWDNVILAAELLYFVLIMVMLKGQVQRMAELKLTYFTMPWNILNFLMCVLSVVYCTFYIYRFVIVSTTVESLRKTYYEQYVDVSFITFWDEMLRSCVGILLFLSMVKCLRLLRYNKKFVRFGDIYRKARRELLIFFGLFMTILLAYTSLGHMLFGSAFMTFRDLWSSCLGVTAMLTGSHVYPEFQNEGQRLAANVYMFSFCIFAVGFLTTYMVAILSHYFKSHKRRRLLAMSGKEAILFYWNYFQLWTGLKHIEVEEEPVIILPPEFTMAEIEYQVDELLFRMNALTGSHGLPEKPPCYLTDSDCTYGAGDDGISSGGSEVYTDDRLEQRVQKIEDNLCSQEPFLAQLFKFDNISHVDDLSQEKEKQLRSHLELEIFRQLQIQRQDLRSPAVDDKGGNSNQAETLQIPHSPGHDSTSSEELVPKPSSKPRRTRSCLTVQTIQDLLAKSGQDMHDSNIDMPSSNPDSPRDKITFAKMRKNIENQLKTKQKQHTSSTSSSEKISPDMSLNHAYLSEKDNIRKPTKPTFLHSRESSLSDAPKGSPIMKLRTAIMPDRGTKTDPHHPTGTGMVESSSGSEQDSFNLGRKLLAKRSLRKTKSRGKGKGCDSLEPSMLLDELEGDDWAGDITLGESGEANFMEERGITLDDLEEIDVEQGVGKCDVVEHTIMADVHHGGE